MAHPATSNLIIDLDSDDSSDDDQPLPIKQWLQSGARSPRPIAGRRGKTQRTESFASSASAPSSQQTDTKTGLATAASLTRDSTKAFNNAWTTATPFFDPHALNTIPMKDVAMTVDAKVISRRNLVIHPPNEPTQQGD